MYIVILSRHRFASGNWGAYEEQQDFALEHRRDLARLLLPPELECDVLVSLATLAQKDEAISNVRAL